MCSSKKKTTTSNSTRKRKHILTQANTYIQKFFEGEMKQMEWVRGERIGHGSFGTVDLAIPTKQNVSLMAVKSCASSHSSSLANEKVILDELKDCPQIIQSFGDCFSVENGEKLYNVLLEYASGGDLADKIKNSSSNKLSEFEVQRCTKLILQGIDSIHRNGFVHCDIKLQNVLLFSSKSKFGGNDLIKIADFGLAKKAGELNTGCELRGTPMYMSPEMVAGGEQEAPADIWALGCMVVEMLTGAPAWKCRRETDFGALFMRIGVGEEVPEIPSDLSEDGRDFLGKCFLKDPRSRWTAEMLLRHPFLTNDDLLECCEVTSTSPRSAFDFPDWVSEQSSQMTVLPSPESALNHLPFHSFESFTTSPAVRLNELVADHETPNWSVFDSWVTVRA